MPSRWKKQSADIRSENSKVVYLPDGHKTYIWFTLRGATREIFLPFQWSLVQSSNLLQFCTPLPPSLHPLSYSLLCALVLTTKKEGNTGWCQTACCPQIIVRCNSQMKKKQIDPEVGLGFLFTSWRRWTLSCFALKHLRFMPICNIRSKRWQEERVFVTAFTAPHWH